MNKMNPDRIIRNINGLTAPKAGEKARRLDLGAYGMIECTKSASEAGSRRFKVTGSDILHNGGNYTLKSLRKAICG